MGLPAIEKKVVLDLYPYFSKNPIVFDVGSNKGEFSDLFVNNVAELHLFEPNEILLHYTMARFDFATNVIYNEKAVSCFEGTCEFKYFINSNNGLSNIINNPKWEYLSYKKKSVETITLNQYWEKRTEVIDFIKIDVEGAEMLVLRGADELLKYKRVKFIQLEKAEHIEVTGHTFEEVIDYLKGFGYTPIVTEDTENVIFSVQGFTQDWNGEFKKNTQGIKVETALEIGCFEGLTTNYICDNLLKEGGRIVCVDPLEDYYIEGHKDNDMFVGQYERFMRNTATRPVELIRKKSRDAFHQLKDLRFGLIYIDGDHREDEVFNDAVCYWNLLLDSPKGSGGYMLFDDYGQSEETARGIDRFLETQKGNYELLVKDYQVLIRRLW
jgi:FkbM family methyltransferase